MVASPSVKMRSHVPTTENRKAEQRVINKAQKNHWFLFATPGGHCQILPDILPVVSRKPGPSQVTACILPTTCLIRNPRSAPQVNQVQHLQTHSFFPWPFGLLTNTIMKNARIPQQCKPVLLVQKGGYWSHLLCGQTSEDISK